MFETGHAEDPPKCSQFTGLRPIPGAQRCASSVFAPLPAWVRSWAALDHSQGETTRAMRIGVFTERPRLEIVRSTHIDA